MALMSQPKNQADQREDVNPVDQFGRLWFCAVEKKTMEACGEISPAGTVLDADGRTVGRWADVLKTPQKYLKIPTNPRNPKVRDITRVVVDFERWIGDQETAEREWKLALWGIGQEKYGAKFNPREAERDDYLLYLTGPKPWPSSIALKAARDGNRGLLGIEPMAATERQLLGLVTLEDLGAVPAASDTACAPGDVTYTGFVKQVINLGLASTIAEAARLWAERKDKLAPQEA